MKMGTRFVLALLYICSTEGNRRLLLNDPDVVNDRILQMEREIQKLTSELMTLRSKVSTLEQAQNGAVYVRWGRKTCPGNGTDLIYTGISGGGYYSRPGSAAEYVCLPHDPDLNTGGVSTNPTHKSHIYGAEYQDNLFGANLFDNDVPCAVCQTVQSSSVIMIPGKDKCPNGWKIEYNGNLACNDDTFAAASQYVCVDKNPEVLEKGQADEDGKLFYPVHAACGSLPCPPYVNDAFLTCVVCSK